MSDRIFVAGHKGMVGSAIVRELERQGKNVIVADKLNLDLRDQSQVDLWFRNNKPAQVYLCAAKVGGIVSNSTYPANFLYDNLLIAANVIDASYNNGVKKLLFLGSTCIYPKECPQPIKEEYLLTSPLETTNEAYAIAKIAGLKLCEAYRKQYGCNFISAMPCNLYGIGDNYHPDNSHVIPGLLNRFHKAKISNEPQVVCWGDGSPMREFLYVDDLAAACTLLMDRYEGNHINIGVGYDITIKQLAHLIKDVVGYTGDIVWDTSKPNGTMKKVTDNSRITSLGWKPKIDLETGLRLSYSDFIKKYE